MDQLFFGRPGAAQTTGDVLGGVSLVIWTITIIVAIKYAILVLRAQNDGEGGVFALYGLLAEPKKRSTTLLLLLLMLGAGLLFADGMITPAISVLSAVEGLHVATPTLGHTVIPITIGLLTVLFAVQFKGTSGIGIVFGSILMVWFAAIAVLGAWQIKQHPEVLAAFNPVYGVDFLRHAGLFDAFLILGALMLVVTGSEAMYADVGHFGARPLRASWFAVVYPALVLNYLGQGAFLLTDTPFAGSRLLYSLVPQSLLYPMISARHRCDDHRLAGANLRSLFACLASDPFGSISAPQASTHSPSVSRPDLYSLHQSIAFAGCILLVMTFGSSSALAPALSLAVCGVTVITSVAMFPIARRYWKWGSTSTGLVWGFLTLVSLTFLVASSLKFLEGGFVPLLVGIGVFLVMTTWRWGRKATFAAYSAKSTMTMAELVSLHRDCKVFMERNAIVMAATPLRLMTDRAPAIMQMLWERHGILPRNLILVEIKHPKVPHTKDNRYLVTVFDREKGRSSIISLELSFGFMEEPNVERLLEEMARHREIDLPTDRHKWIVHVSQENLRKHPVKAAG